MGGKFHRKKYQNARTFSLSHTSKQNQQKQRDVSKSAANNTSLINMISPRMFIIDQSQNT